MKKILLFTDSLGAGGAQRQLVGLAIFLQERGYEVKVCTYHNLSFYKAILDENQIANELIAKADNRWKRIRVICNYLKRESPSCIISYQETPSIIACVYKLLGGTARLIVSERNTTQSVGIVERIRFCLYHLADAIIPNSFSQTEFLLSHYPWMIKNLTTISNFVDLRFFGFTLKDKHDTPKILVAATIWPPKNTIGFIHAVKSLKERGCKFIVEWYGITEAYSDYLYKCQDLIAELELEGFIKLLPKSTIIQEKYKDCDFVCLPSFYEGTPNVICEAMSCGRPIICSSVCDNPFYVKEGENGFLFDPTKPESIADSIERALQITNVDYINLCSNSRKMAEKLLSKDVFVNKYIKIIEGE